MRDIDNLLTSGKNLNKKNNRRAKSFGYQVLGFGAGGAGFQGITATGGTITLCGTCTIHTFTGPGTFAVSALASDPANDVMAYMVVAGGGGGGGRHGGGGGAGGFREGRSNCITPYTASPLVTTGITATVTSYPITVGGGGTAGNRSPNTAGTNGADSIALGITSTGGGRGHTYLSILLQYLHLKEMQVVLQFLLEKMVVEVGALQ